MTKGLRCPNCDTTINKRVVLDFLLNKKTPHIRCNNAFCNVRWSRTALEAHKAVFLGEDSPMTVVKVPAPKPKPVEKRAVVKNVAPPIKVVRPTIRKGEDWIDRIRAVARQIAKAKGVVSADELRTWADDHHLQPGSSSAWGSVFQSDQWKNVSQKNSSYVKSRSRKITVWALKMPSLVTA